MRIREVGTAHLINLEERLLDDRDGLAEVLLSNDEWRRKANDVDVRGLGKLRKEREHHRGKSQLIRLIGTQRTPRSPDPCS
jgi:hypothetical protein